MVNKDYVLGLDLGIASCGYAIIDTAKREIVTCGVRCFEKAEHPKTGASLALPRRQKRSLRRVTDRRVRRLRGIQHLLRSAQIITSADWRSKAKELDPWQLRADALKRMLSGEELACVLLHIAKRRGFKSSRKDAQKQDKELGKLSEGVNNLTKEFRESGFATIGAYLNSLHKKKNSDGDYKRTVLRKLNEEEVDLIFQIQSKLGNKLMSDSLREQYKGITFYQRPLKSTLDMVGKCEHEKGERRAPRDSYTAERFRLFQELLNLRLYSRKTGEISLSIGQIQQAVKLAYSIGEVKYKQLRKHLALDESLRFSKLNYPRPRLNSEASTKKEDPEKSKFIHLKFYHTIEAVVSQIDASYWDILKNESSLLDDISWILTVYKDDAKIEKKLLELGVPQTVAAELVGLSFSQHARLSFKAMRKILVHFEEGLNYSEACEKLGYGRTAVSKGAGAKLPPLDPIPNPVVNRALAQTRKVVNALFREYGIPNCINIELGRELGRSFEKRREIQKEQEENRKYNEQLFERVRSELGKDPNGTDLLKFRLWEEQAGFCAYSMEYISRDQLKDPTATEIDHIVPFSRSFDDSFNNKVLVTTKENRNKRERTPFEYFGHDADRWAKFNETIVKKVNDKKAQRLTILDFDADAENSWKERNLTDTRYITRTFMNYLKSSIDFGAGNEVHVAPRNGRITSILRRLWGLGEKDRAASDKHHAEDAIIVAMSTAKMVNILTEHSQRRERGQLAGLDSMARRLPLPWIDFREQVKESVSNVFVSRMPNRKGGGALHEDTIRSERILADGQKIILERIKLEGLDLKRLEDLWQKERNQRLYHLLKERLEKFDGNPKKAFAEPIYMPTNDGSKTGPVIRAVTLETGHKSGIYVRGQGENRRGIASNGDMVRCDVYCKENKFYCVPVYAWHVMNNIVPNRAIFQGKREADWPEIDLTYNFMFSLFQNDFIEISGSEGVTSGYYIKIDRSNGAISLKAHDRSDEIRKGTKTLKSFKKFAVDVLGRRTLVKPEMTNGVAYSFHQQSGKAQRKE